MRSMIVTRGEVPNPDGTFTALPDLQLWAPGDYLLLEGFAPGQQQRRRLTTESPIVVGRYTTSVVEAARIAVVPVYVQAETSDRLQPKVEALLAAFAQFRYQLAWTYDGLGGVWVCEAADYAVGDTSGVLDEFWLGPPGPVGQTVFLTVPHRRLSGL